MFFSGKGRQGMTRYYRPKMGKKYQKWTKMDQNGARNGTKMDKNGPKNGPTISKNGPTN